MKSVVLKVFSVVGVAVLIAGCGTDSKPTPSSEAAAPTPAPAVTPVLATVVAPPVPVPATDGKVHLAYELQVTNAMGSDVTLASLEVKAGDRTLLTLARDKLAYWTRALGAGTKPTTTLGPGQAGVVWLDVVVDNGTPAPTELSHTIVVNVAKPMPPLIPATVSENVAPVTVSTHKPAVISPPLSGPNWLDGNSCCDMTAHRMAMNPLDGGLWGAERFAIDYLQLSPDGTVFKGPKDKTESYPYFGADIHAVADGPVVGVVDGLPEQVAGKSPTGLPLDQYGGNHVVQDISGGGTERRYAFYA
ncbi:MAG: hypothetical protein QOJ80_6965, partial [Mycobacterium sp.]|nr:hypothetical protein [Mycobacterium sp.]